MAGKLHRITKRGFTMIRIAIVEDDTGYRSQLGKYINQYQSDFSETVSVSEFSEYDIILMDIQMKHMDGMQAAMRIRDMDKNVIIIFITNSAQFAVQGYKVEALDYVLKPIQYFAFSQVLHNAVKKVHGKSKFYIHLIQESKMIRLDADQILYIESRGHTIIYHTEIGEYAERGSLKSAEEKLAQRHYYKCNNCYLVNLAHVERVNQLVVTVKGQALQISRARKKSFMEALAAYMGGE